MMTLLVLAAIAAAVVLLQKWEAQTTEAQRSKAKMIRVETEEEIRQHYRRNYHNRR